MERREPEAVSAHPAVLFVCLGNICRSPLAEAYFGDEAGFEVTWRDVSEAVEALGRRLLHAGSPLSA